MSRMILMKPMNGAVIPPSVSPIQSIDSVNFKQSPPSLRKKDGKHNHYNNKRYYDKPPFFLMRFIFRKYIHNLLLLFLCYHPIPCLIQSSCHWDRYCFITCDISYCARFRSISPTGKVNPPLLPQSSCIHSLAIMLEGLMYERSDGMYYDGLR